MTGPDRPASIVLVVDDSPDTLGMLSTALEAAGYTVLLAQSGMAALALTGTEGATPHAVALAALVPAVVVGHLAGRPVFARIAEDRYERVLTAVLIATALAGLATALF